MTRLLARGLSFHPRLAPTLSGSCSFFARSVKEMDPGQIGVVIKVFNMATGLVLMLWAGIGMVLQIVSYADCDEDTVDSTCCPSNIEGNIKCTSPMSLLDNFPALVISVYMIPLGMILVLYEVSTKRAGATEVRDPDSSARPRPHVALVFRHRLTLPALMFAFRRVSLSRPGSGRRSPRSGKA